MLAEAVQIAVARHPGHHRPGDRATASTTTSSASQPFTPEDFPNIEKKMREIIQRKTAPFTKEVWSRDEAKHVFSDKGENFKVELVDAIPADQDLKIYKQGEWFDLCRGPHMTSTGKVGNAFKLMKVAGAYWRGDPNNPMLTRIYGTGLGQRRRSSRPTCTQLEEAEKRDHRKLGREMDLFHFQEEAPGVGVLASRRAGRCSRRSIAYMRRRLDRAGYQEVNSPQLDGRGAVGASGHWDELPREHVR